MVTLRRRLLCWSLSSTGSGHLQNLVKTVILTRLNINRTDTFPDDIAAYKLKNSAVT